MQDTASTIKYWIKQSNAYPGYYRTDSGPQGVWVGFLDAFTDETGIATELVTEKDGQSISATEALDMLECGELDAVLGLPAEMNTGDEDAMWAISEGIYVNELTAYILKDSPQAERSDFENCYWAIDGALKGMLKGTPFDGHTIDFADRAQMYGALENGDVYGVLDTRSCMDYGLLATQRFEYRQCVAVSMPYTECVYVRRDDEALLATVNEVLAGAELYSTEGERGYANLLADAYSKTAGFRTATYALAGAAIVLAAVCAVLFRKLGSQRSLERAKLGTVLAGDPSKELMELDLRSKTLRSYNDFAIFGERGREIPNPVRLSELSGLLGYDFTAHYGDVSTHISRKYSNRLIIHVDGTKLYIAEEGIRTGHILMLTLTRM